MCEEKIQVSTRLHDNNCQIYVRNGSKSYMGKIVELINDMKAVIEHSCIDEAKCITNS